ncbi:MAG: carboxypeptidase M32 [Bacteroidota bacterium]|nr:carboxypeptidase M32 [Bacteroidota bacterium]
MPNGKELYELYKSNMHRIADVRYATAVLQWDQETYLPPKGAATRGRQISTLSEIAHQLFSEESLGNLLQELLSKDDLSAVEKRNVERTWEDYTKNKKYTSAFVRQLTEQINKTFHAWIEARKQNSFSLFENDLQVLVRLKKEEAEILGYEHHPYNALLNEHEKGVTIELLDKTFTDLLPSLKILLENISAKPQIDDAFLKQFFPGQQQWNWGLFLIRQLGFDVEAGRQDKSEHPFTISFSAQDVRITTRIDERDFGNMTWSCIHEAGHALYEQGLPEEQYGLPLGEACSFSIHESQSRLWENNVGRSTEFWRYFYQVLQQHFPDQFGIIDETSFYKAINKVEPALIRTEADEISYHFHVYIRYQLERNLLDGTLDTKDIRAFWKEQYKKAMDIEVPDDKRGALQDVHWSHGSFGYFPTYSLGSFYAAQFYAKAQSDVPELEVEISRGNLQPLLQWLRSEIHAQGRYYTSEELCEKVTAKTLDVSFFLDYILEKYTGIYNL